MGILNELVEINEIKINSLKKLTMPIKKSTDPNVLIFLSNRLSRYS